MFTEEWHDGKRNRTVPVRIFRPDPETHAPPCPVVLLSHGLGGNRDGFGYLGDDWSSHGYVVLVMQHAGSDSDARVERRSGETPLQALARAADVEAGGARVGDVSFVLDELEKRLSDKVDPERIGIGGHSFGSYTTFASIGRLPFQADPRLKAAVVMSPNTLKAVDPLQAHRDIRTPVFHLTGTKDRSPIDWNFPPVRRRVPFDSISKADQYLVVFEDGNHTLFSGHRRPFGLSKLEEQYQPMVAEMTRRFFDAYLKNDAEAKEWLQSGGLSDRMDGCGTVEIKIP